MLTILQFTIPSLITLLCVWLVLRYTFKTERDKRMWEMKRNTQIEITPIRLRAYERLALLLERTEPEQMVAETDFTGMTVTQLEQHLLTSIRREWEHNMSQQIYVSNEVWDKIMHARDQMAEFVHTMAAQMPKNATPFDYARVLMTAYSQNGITPHQIALESLKDEVRTLW